MVLVWRWKWNTFGRSQQQGYISERNYTTMSVNRRKTQAWVGQNVMEFQGSSTIQNLHVVNNVMSFYYNLFTCMQCRTLGQNLVLCWQYTWQSQKPINCGLMAPAHLQGLHTASGDQDYAVYHPVLLPSQHICSAFIANICCLATFKRRTEHLPCVEVDS